VSDPPISVGPDRIKHQSGENSITRRVAVARASRRAPFGDLFEMEFANTPGPTASRRDGGVRTGVNHLSS